MSEATPLARIQQAATLLKNGDRARAYSLLKQAVRDDPVEWRAWWGLAHATTSAQERYNALKKTVQLNPDHAKAQELLAKAQPQAQPRRQPVPAPEPSASPFDSGSYSGDPEPFDGGAYDNDPHPFDSGTYSGDPSPFEDIEGDSSNPFDYQIIENKPQEWSIPATEPAAPKKSTRTQGSSTDQLINAAIAILGVLVVAGILIIVLSRANIDLGSLTQLSGAASAPNTYNGGDPYTTTGGGTLVVNSAAIVDELDDLTAAHNWTFEGEAGQVVRIQAVAIGDTDPRVKLLGPDGTYLAEDDDSGYQHNLGDYDAYLEYQIPQNGTYTIRVDVFYGGQFQLSVSG
jgi:hypothetical protein